MACIYLWVVPSQVSYNPKVGDIFLFLILELFHMLYSILKSVLLQVKNCTYQKVGNHDDTHHEFEIGFLDMLLWSSLFVR